MTTTVPTPIDVKLMNMTASALFVAFALMVVGAVAGWAWRHPVFALRGITVSGDVTHNNALTLRANVASRLSGTFLTIDLTATRLAFEAVPWVRSAVVRREFPNRLKVLLQEHQAVAYWGLEGESRLLNNFGEVFEANVGEVEQEDLPRLNGPDGQSAQVLAMYQALQPQFEDMDMALEQIELTGHGGWRARLDSGAVIELGGGTEAEVLARTQRFLKTLTQVASRYGRKVDALETADLRHQDGYAIRLRGVTTLAADGQKK
ncbi:cell division protein FtsQ/DivIB [Rhodoferax sp. UBA5149]|uniref:cell division protein FtsQ/DivIB n=1 Tax=Rhodoferax sp. UBA5149 TaxID=1947379 RepID=UPI0025FDF1B6|nr:cell division protein FtsQ/DivIB [Rhodoferax sp. UBA5149]